jgi:hydrogenase/urease accessory protein HupE
MSLMLERTAALLPGIVEAARRSRHGAARSPRLAALAFAALALTLTATALAHELSLSRGDYAVDNVSVTAELTFAQSAIAAVAPRLDRDHDEALSAEEILKGQGQLAELVVPGLLVEADGRPCAGKLASSKGIEQDGITFRLSYTCPTAASEVRFDLALLDALPLGHRHVFHSGTGGAQVDAILNRERRSVEVLTQPSRAPAGPSAAAPLDASASPAPAPLVGADGEPASPAPTVSLLDFFTMGIEHILTGFDHLVFLLGLVLVGGNRRALVLVVTAFTVAHSMTLGLAVLGVWSPSPRFIEPAIALSIAYVGVENYFVRDAAGRWRITLPFGLIHGFGFAGALQEIAMPRADVPGALLAFNLGVESGQLAVLAAALPLLALARRRAWFDRVFVKVASGSIVLLGLFWFAVRLSG